jgi:hypothetical protein
MSFLAAAEKGVANVIDRRLDVFECNRLHQVSVKARIDAALPMRGVVVSSAKSPTSSSTTRMQSMDSLKPAIGKSNCVLAAVAKGSLAERQKFIIIQQHGLSLCQDGNE